MLWNQIHKENDVSINFPAYNTHESWYIYWNISEEDEIN